MTRKNKPPVDEQEPPPFDRQAHDAEWRARMESHFLNEGARPLIPHELAKTRAIEGLKTTIEELRNEDPFAKMRSKRDRPELTEAILAEVDELTRDSAWEKAGLFRGKINTWLERRDPKPATQKSIYDRIVKILRT